VIVGIGSDVGLPLPNLIGASRAPVPLSFIPPLAVAIALASGLDGGNRELERVAVRGVRLLDACYVLSVALVTLLGCIALAAVLPPGNTGLAAGRDALGYAGVMLIGRRLVGRNAATLAPSMYLILASLLRPSGAALSGSWDWALASSDNPLSWCTAVGLLAIGTTVGSRDGDT
jgi:hypothetical protein